MRFDQPLQNQGTEAVQESFRQVIETGQPAKAIDWTFTRKDGGRRHAEVSIAPIRDAADRIVGVRGLLRDVTERKEAEVLQQTTRAAEAASRSKSEFLANMSHEIRTPLNSIIGMVELLQQQEMTAAQREDLSVVHAAAHALLSVINDILDFSKIEAGKLELEETPFDLRAMVDEAQRIMAGRAHEKRLDLVHRVSPAVPGMLIGDPNRLRQVLLNLVGNAVKFTERGQVLLDVDVEATTQDEVVLKVSVSDTGVGVPPDKQQAIFGAFDQADSSTTRRYGGTGLGLAVSSQLVDLMGGCIRVESAPGEGSTFFFTARFGQVRGNATPATPDTADDLAGVRVLVVDDNAATGRVLQEMLADWRVFPAWAADTQRALEMLAQKADAGIPFEVVMIDAALPDDGCGRVLEWIGAHRDVKMRPVLLLSQPQERGGGAAGGGVAAQVTKPIGAAALREVLRTALGQRPSIDRGGRFCADAGAFSRPLHVLVAEDLPFNQKFIRRLMEHWGHTTVMVENGREALDALLADDSFDLVLMDVQMPSMDGFSATRAIREREAGADVHLPIIAMTAHAMRGDRERCLEAGMDAYISKPIAAQRLIEIFQRLRPDCVAGAGERSADERSPAVLDTDALLNDFGGDKAFLMEVVDSFMSDYPQRLAAIKAALDNGAAEEIERAAHDLKGMLNSFNAGRAAELARQLEQKARSGHLNDGCAALFADLESQMAAISAQLKAFGEHLAG